MNNHRHPPVVPADVVVPAGTSLDSMTAADPETEQMSLTERIVILGLVVIPLLGFAAAVAILWGRHELGAMEVTLFVAMYCVSILGVTVGFHRLFTHLSYDAAKPVKYVIAACGSMAAQGPVLTWCGVHRIHHQCSDKAGDPHSPHLHGDSPVEMIKGFWHAHVGWLFLPKSDKLAKYIPDLLADRGLVLIDRLFFPFVVLGLLIPTALGGLWLGGWTSFSWFGALQGFLWGGLVRLFISHHVTWSINSICHIWGSRPYRSHDLSTNNWLFAILGFGEGWHNNHHAFPASARHGLRWWQFDTSYLIIKTMSYLRLARNIRVPSPQHLAMKLKATTHAAPQLSPES